MSAFDLFPTALAHERGEAVDFNKPARFFEGSLSAPAAGAAKGLLVEPARITNMALSTIPGAIDRAFGTSTRDWWFDNMMLKDAHQRVTPNPRETGKAGQFLHSLFDVGSQAVVAGPAGVMVAKTVGGTIEGAEQGLDFQTAGKKALVEASAAAAGVALPIYMPPLIGSRIPKLVQQVGYGVASNVPLGIAQRGLTHEILAKAGYNEMAEQYKALDETALMTDVVLGIAFGGLGHVLQTKGTRLGALRPSDIDAALVKRNAYHVEIDGAPGLPKTPQARDAHVDAHLEATAALIEGRPVDVGKQLEGAEFIPNRDVDAARTRLIDEQKKVGQAYDKVLGEPLGPVNDPVVRMTPDQIGAVLLERGPAGLKKGTADIKVGGYGLVKIIWKHGEKSGRELGDQVTREDVTRVPQIMNDFAPISDKVQDDGKRLTEWQVQRNDGKKIIYAVRRFSNGDKQQHVVSIMINRGANDEMAGKPLSQERQNRLPDSPGVAFKASPRDTAAATSDSSLKGQVSGSAATVPQIHAALKAEGLELSGENVSVVQQIAQARAADAKAVDALPEGMPDGEYMAKIKEIGNAGKTTEAAGADRGQPGDEGSGGAGGEARGGQEGGQAAGGQGGEAQPGGKSARLVEDAEIKDAEQIATDKPDLPVMNDDGTTTTAKQALARADEIVAQAEQEARAFEAAVLCATRRGG